MCLGHTHAIAGATACAAVAATVWHPGVMTLAGGVVLCAGVGLINDIDHPDSTVKQALGPVTWLLSWTVRQFTHGVPRRTHSLPVMVIACTLAWWQESWWQHVPAGIAYPKIAHILAGVCLFLTIAVLISAAIRGLTGHSLQHTSGRINRHGRHHGYITSEHGFTPGHLSDWLGIGAAVAVLRTGWGLPLLVPAVAVGMTAHIILDSLTDDGCPWFWPFDGTSHHLLPVQFKTGHAFERAFRWVLIVTLGYLLLIDTAPMFPGAALLAAIHHHLEALR